jgi:hypothetical protein
MYDDYARELRRHVILSRRSSEGAKRGEGSKDAKVCDF